MSLFVLSSLQNMCILWHHLKWLFKKTRTLVVLDFYTEAQLPIVLEKVIAIMMYNY